MQNKIIGVDPYVSSIPASTPSSTIAIDNVTASTANDGPEKFVPTVDYTVNQVVVPALAKLLAKMLAMTDASLPNKDQNRGVKKVVRESFDEAYFRILREAYPDCQFAPSANSYSLEPEPDKRANVIL